MLQSRSLCDVFGSIAGCGGTSPCSHFIHTQGLQELQPVACHKATPKSNPANETATHRVASKLTTYVSQHHVRATKAADQMGPQQHRRAGKMHNLPNETSNCTSSRNSGISRFCDHKCPACSSDTSRLPRIKLRTVTCHCKCVPLARQSPTSCNNPK